MQRRKLLAVLGGVGAAALAGCSGGGDEGATQGPTANQTEDDSETATSNGSGGTQTEETFSLGEPVWGQANADSAATSEVDAVGVTASDPASYQMSVPDVNGVDYQPHYDPAFTENALIHRGAIREKTTGEKIRSLRVTETTTPAVAGGRIIIASGATVIAFDAESYEVLWRYTTVKNTAVVTATSERVFLALGDAVTALSATDGERLWNVSVKTPSYSGPRTGRVRIGQFGVIDGRLYAGQDRGASPLLSVFDVTDGSEMWTVEGGPGQIAPDGQFYRDSFETSGIVQHDELGNQVASYDRPEGTGSPGAADEERLYFYGGKVAAMNTDDGSVAWNKQLPLRPIDAAVGAERLYVLATGNNSNRLFALNKRTGTREGLYSLKDRATGGVTVGGGVVATMGNPADYLGSGRMNVLVDQ